MSLTLVHICCQLYFAHGIIIKHVQKNNNQRTAQLIYNYAQLVNKYFQMNWFSFKCMIFEKKIKRFCSKCFENWKLKNKLELFWINETLSKVPLSANMFTVLAHSIWLDGKSVRVNYGYYSSFYGLKPIKAQFENCETIITHIEWVEVKTTTSIRVRISDENKYHVECVCVCMCAGLLVVDHALKIRVILIYLRCI